MPRVSHQGAELAYEVVGAGPPLLMLMGFGASRRAWVRQRALATSLGLVLVDNRGVGESTLPPAPCSTRLMAEDARAVLDGLGTESAHVLGVSLGGAVAQELALLAPQRVRSLILVSTFARSWRKMRQAFERTATALGVPAGADLFPRLRAASRDADVATMLEALLPYLFGRSFWSSSPESVRAELRAAVASGFSVEGLLGQLEAALGHDALERLSAIRAPTLVLHGDADPVVPLAHGERLVAAIPGAQLLGFPGGTHALFLHGADELNPVIENWVEQIEEERACAADLEPEAVQIPIDGTLDLHTFHPREVKDLLEEYLAQCRERGILEVRVIHGKGTGALRRTVRAALARNPAVASFASCGEDAGGWGATRVQLRPGGEEPG